MKKFSTIELAKNQCSLNNDCKAVLDLNCQGKSDAFYLCDYESIVAHNNFGCIYQKYRGKLRSSTYFHELIEETVVWTNYI